MHSDLMKPYLGPLLRNWLSVRASAPPNDPNILQDVPERMAVDDVITPSSTYGELGDSEFLVEEEATGGIGNQPEQEDCLSNTGCVAYGVAKEPSGGSCVEVAKEEFQFPATATEEGQRGRGRRRVNAPKRFGE